jgi:sulfite reductase alpha subunit-like flavoprotein
MMGFLQERAARAAAGEKLGPAVLFFGCRTSKDDYIYKDEMSAFLDSGVLSGLHVALSREGATKVGNVVSYTAVLTVQHSPMGMIMARLRCGYVTT